jgi:apolipoprotein N-acyltransferase
MTEAVEEDPIEAPGEDEAGGEAKGEGEATAEVSPSVPRPSGSGPASPAKKKPEKRSRPPVEVADEPLPPDPEPVITGGARPLGTAQAYGLAFATGFLYFLAFPGIDLWPLSFVALVPLIVALRGQTPRRAAGLGWLAGFTMTMFGFYWLLEMLKVFSGFPLPLCVLFMAILCGYQAGRIALCGWLYGRADRRGWPPSLAFGLAFVASELVFPLLFPWYYAATLHNAPVLMQLADLGGPYLVAAMLCAVNVAVAELIVHRREKRPRDRRVLIAGAAALAVALAYGYVRLRMVDAAAATATPVKIGIVQGNQPLLGRNHALDVHMQRTRELKNRGAELVVWSEGGSGTATMESKNEEETRRRFTQRLGVPTIVGTILVRGGQDRGHETLFNTALLSVDGGAIAGRYDKEYLLAFGEYIPFGDTFPKLYEWSPNSSHFSAGTSLEPLPWGDHKISALICYEDILPAFVNKAIQHADPDLIVNLTNDTWFGDSTEPYIHFALAKLRAVEHRRYLVRATNSGLSGIIDPVGRTILRGETFQEQALLGEARFMRSKTGYEILGDYPWWLATIAILWMAFRPRFQKGLPKKAV